jgi:hypothetical protein
MTQEDRKREIEGILFEFRANTERLFPDSDSKRKEVFNKAVEQLLSIRNLKEPK